jgi:hypothetical protein
MRTAALRKPAIEPLYVSRERILLIHGTHYNLNLRELYEAIFGAPSEDLDVLFVLAPGARILSRRADLPACRTGCWPFQPRVNSWAH